MRVLWLSHLVPYPPLGGAQKRAWHLLRCAAAVHDVDLYALHQCKLVDRSDLDPAIEVLRRICRSVNVFPIPAERTIWTRTSVILSSVASRHQPYDTRWLQSKAFSNALKKYREHIDLIHIDTVGLAPYLSDAGRGPFVLDHHNVESSLAEQRASWASPRWRAALIRREARKLEALERTVAPKAAMNLLASSTETTRLLQVAAGARAWIVPNGVDTEHFRANHPAERREGLLFVGTLDWAPNAEALRLLLHAIWPALNQDGKARRLTIVGRRPPAFVRRAERQPGVRVTGQVPDVRPYLSAAAVFACPIRIGGGTRLKVLEALAMACPIVASTVAVEGLGLVDGEHFLVADTPAAFVRQIRRLERDPSLGKRLASAGRSLVERRFAWTRVGQALHDAYTAAVTIGQRAHRAMRW